MAERQIPFQIKAISTVEFATIPDSFNADKPLDIGTGFNYSVNELNKSITVSIDLNFESSKKPFIVLKLDIEFAIEPKAYKNFFNLKEKKMILPRGFLIHLAALTIGTARGVLHSKLSHSDLDHIVLPAINVSGIMKEDVVITLE